MVSDGEFICKLRLFPDCDYIANEYTHKVEGVLTSVAPAFCRCMPTLRIDSMYLSASGLQLCQELTPSSL